MKNKFQRLRLSQLDNKLNNKYLKEMEVPSRGWIWEIRNTLGMSHSQLGKRLKISAPAVAGFEKSELKGSISIKSLKKIANAMKCNLVYCIVPVTSLEKILEEQSFNVTRLIFNRVNQSMKLEDQDSKSKRRRKQMFELAEELNKEIKGKIWDYEV